MDASFSSSVNWPLVYHNIVSVVFLLTSLWLAFFVLFKNPLKSVNITFFGLTSASAIVYFTHLVGVNTENIFIADAALQWNLIIVPLVAFNNHLVFAVLGQEWKKRYWIASVYLVATVITVFFILNPRMFLDWPVPKMYFNFYYVPGDYYWVMRVFQNIVPVYFLYHLAMAFWRSMGMERKRLQYFLFGLVYGYGASVFILFLMYDIQVNPIYAMTFGLYTVFFAYGILKYELLEIRVVAKRALGYVVAITSISFVIIGANYFSRMATEKIPGFPEWAVPSFSAIFVVVIGYFLWKKIHEVDELKYEFITIVTHKFRTPLTFIKWASESVLNGEKKESVGEQVKKISEANEKLIGLTNSLIEVTGAEEGDYLYHFEGVQIDALWKEIVATQKEKLTEKSITLNFSPNLNFYIQADKKRIFSVLNVLFENALMYTPSGGTIKIETRRGIFKVFSCITDTGIGIPKKDVPKVFSKFFRSKNAFHVDTEGIGIGLYISRNVLKNHGGKISVFSAGEGKGTTFCMTLKKA
ncbi:MAG: ATP-binding protein [bacterium]|nr:ATP-binding protein [bacterium]